MNELLKKWILDSDKWVKEIEICNQEENLPEFIKNYEDFYMALFFNFMDLLSEIINDKSVPQTDIKSIGRTLQIFSLRGTKEYFCGIDEKENLLYSASAYYLADHVLNSVILCGIVETNETDNEMDIFILNFLKNTNTQNHLLSLLKSYFENGDYKYINTVFEDLNSIEELAIKHDPDKYIKARLIKALIMKMLKNSIWEHLNCYSDLMKEEWQKFINAIISAKHFKIELTNYQKRLLKGNWFNSQNLIATFASPREKIDSIRLLIYNHIRSNIGNRVLWVVKNINSITDRHILEQSGIKVTFISEEADFCEEADVLIITIPVLTKIDCVFYSQISLIIFDDFYMIGNSTLGIKYDYLIGKIISRLHNSSKIYIVDSSIYTVLKNNINGFEKTFRHEDLSDSETDLLVSCFVEESRDEFLTVNAESDNGSYAFNGLFQTQNSYITGKSASYRTFSKIQRTCFLALELILRDIKVNIFTPQIYIPKFGLIRIAEEFLKILEHPQQEILPIRSDLKDVETYLQTIFGKDYYITRLIKYGILVYHGNLPAFLCSFFENLIKDRNISLVISNASFINTECFNNFDALVIHMLRLNADFGNSNYWKNMTDSEVVKLARSMLGKNNKNKYIFLHNKCDIQIYKSALTKLTDCKLDSYLHQLMKEIKQRIEIHPQLLLENNDKFDMVLGQLDYSILDALIEESNLYTDIYNFFCSYDSLVDSDKNLLKETIRIRKSYITQNIDQSSWKYLKGLGCNTTLYRIMNEVIEENLRNLQEIDFFSYIENFLIKIILILPETEYRLKKLNKDLKEKFTEDKNIITIIFWQWLYGEEYLSICLYLNTMGLTIDINDLLQIFSSFFEGYMYPMINNISDYIHVQTELGFVNKFPDIGKCLYYGCTNHTGLWFHELGLNEKVVNKKLVELFAIWKIYPNSKEDLMSILTEKKFEILANLRDEDPFIQTSIKNFINTLLSF